MTDFKQIQSIGRLQVKDAHGVNRCPTDILQQLSEDHGAVVQYETLFNQFTLFSHPDAVREILLGHNFVRIKLIKSILGSGMLTSDGPHWERQRRLMIPEFKSQQVEQWTALFSRLAQERVASWDDLQPGEPLLLSQEMERMSLSALGHAMFDCSIDPGFLDAFGTVMRELSAIGNSNAFGYSLRRKPGDNQRFKESMDFIHGIVTKILASAGACPASPVNLLSRMLQHGQPEISKERSKENSAETGCPAHAEPKRPKKRSAQPLTEQQVRDEIITMITAGTETSAVTMTWALYLIATNPQAAEKFYAEVDTVLGQREITAADPPNLPYTRMIIAETLRLYPPIWLIGRKAERDDTVMGVPVPAGSGVMISPYVIHRHPDFWENPNDFIPERFADGGPDHLPYAYFPFLGGRHRCLGEQFALTEAIVTLATIAQKYTFTLRPEHPVVLDPLISLRIRDGLWVDATKRQPAPV